MLIAHVLRLTKWEWFKLRRRWMPWILLAIAVLLSQLGIWVNYVGYHNETVQEVVSGGSASYGMSWEEEDGQKISVEVSCTDFTNDRMPPELDQLTEELRKTFQRDLDEWYESGACDNYRASDEFRKGFTLPHSITRTIADFHPWGPCSS